MPYLIFTQAIPIIAVAPLIIIWAGPEIKSKIVIAGLITWFPIMIATMVGIRNVSPDLRELMRANAANPWQIFWNLEVPSALPEILGGIKVGVTLSIIGAAVGEFVSSREGLGYLVFFGKSISNTPIVIVAIFSLTLMSLSLFGIVAAVEQVLLRWKYAGNS
jgi:NitT/TauT family transport system permease protein